MEKWAGALLIEKSGKAILQKRDNKPDIVNPGKITLFGGGVEAPETEEACFKREVKEEVGLTVSSFSYLGLYQKKVASHGEDRDCYVYLVENIDLETIKVSEGQGYVLISAEDNYLKEEYSLITQSVLSDYFRKSRR